MKNYAYFIKYYDLAAQKPYSKANTNNYKQEETKISLRLVIKKYSGIRHTPAILNGITYIGF